MEEDYERESFVLSLEPSLEKIEYEEGGSGVKKRDEGWGRRGAGEGGGRWRMMLGNAGRWRRITKGSAGRWIFL